MDTVTMLTLLVLITGLFALAAGAALFLLQRYQSPEPSLIQQRLGKLKSVEAQVVTAEEEQARKVSRFYKEAEYHNEKLGKQFERFSFFRTLKQRMQQAGIKTPPDKYFLNNMLAPFVLFTLAGMATRMIPVMFLGLLIAFGAYFSINLQRGRRTGKFITQLPDALGMITSSLRAGHSFQSALTVVSTELPDPIATEFASLVRDINLGIPVKEALNRMVSKLDTVPDIRMFATAVSIQREAGGNLAEVLEKLGYTIRERFKLKGQIAALTGQARLTGYVLGAAPALILTGLSLFMYNYVKPLYETDMGRLALVAVVILQAIGFTVMRKIIDIRV